MSGLTTHILDLTAGRPAADVVLRLFRLGGEPLGEAVTNADGRARLADSLTPGGYRIEFEIGAYFRRTGASAAAPGSESARSHVTPGPAQWPGRVSARQLRPLRPLRRSQSRCSP